MVLPSCSSTCSPDDSIRVFTLVGGQLMLPLWTGYGSSDTLAWVMTEEGYGLVVLILCGVSPLLVQGKRGDLYQKISRSFGIMLGDKLLRLLTH